MKLPWFLLLLSCYHLSFPISSNGNQIKNLQKLISSRRSSNPPRPESWSITELDDDHEENNDFSSTFVGGQEGLKEADKIKSLPGQPEGVDFDQYAGYVTVDEKAGRTLFYYFVESPKNSSINPLVLWLNGGPGCSSFGYGAMEELGPFRVKSDGKTLYRNKYAWNNVANVLFLETPTGVGFSYSNTAFDYSNVGDKKTADDSYTFLINWLERFPQYKTRDFFIAGESYAGHFVPQLAYTILYKNKKSNRVTINLKGIAIGNAWMDENTAKKGTFDYYWTHALNSDETNAAIHKYCDFLTGNFSVVCEHYQKQSYAEMGVGLGYINEYNIYAPLCNTSPELSHSVEKFDPCSDSYVKSYLNRAEVQAALHAKATQWSFCSGFNWTDSPRTVLPTIKQLITKGIMVWLYSGDGDANVPVTTTRYAINALKVPVEKAWRPWYSGGEVGGYVVGYSGVTLVTVRGAGHDVPSYQPERALTMIASFLEAKFPPPLPSNS